MKGIFRTREFLPAMFLSVCVFALAVRLAAHDESCMNMQHDHLHHSHAKLFAKIPEKARVRPNPLADDPDAVAAGKKLFGLHCAECHGESAEGTHRAPSLHADEVQDATPGAIFWILSNGVIRHGMPDWSKLPDAQRWQITAYIKSLRSAPSSEMPSPPKS
jgi:mono/diheme cytochrome c family protein